MKEVFWYKILIIKFLYWCLSGCVNQLYLVLLFKLKLLHGSCWKFKEKDRGETGGIFP